MITNKNSLINNLEIKFETLQNMLWDFLSDIKIKANNNHFKIGEFSGVSVGRPAYSWQKLTLQQDIQYIEISGQYNSFIKSLDGLMEHTPNKIHEKYKSIKKEFEVWVLLENNFALDSFPENNKKNYMKNAKQLKEIMSLFQGKTELIVVPDTNALLMESDPIKYKSIIQEKSFTFLLLPTVISELDKMKMEYEESKVKEKAKKIIKRIKGWRNQGKITEGVTVDKTISLRAEVLEPNFRQMPSWLNRENNDDIIIMYILDIQRRFPSATVILVSRDINMQNKAEHTMIGCIDIELQKENG